MMTITSQKRYALDWIDEHTRRFSDFHLRIWSPIFICTSGTTPNLPRASTNRRKPIAICGARKGLQSRRARVQCQTAFAARWGWTRLTEARTVLYGYLKSRRDAMLRKGAEEARNQLPDLLEAAEKGRSTIITRHGRQLRR